MFAHEIILAKTGPLARIWLAAHWDKKLKKKDIFETKLVESVENIINPKMKLALRTSGHLLLGVVKIYSRKTGFLYTDCNEAIVKLRSAFRPGVVNEGPPRESKTKAKAQQLFFTADFDLPDIDTPIPDLNDLDLDKNRARLEEITLREENDFLSVNDLGGLDGDQALDNSELAIDLDNEEMMRNLNEVFGDNQMDTFDNRDASLMLDEDGLKTETDDGFGQDMSNKMDDGATDADKMLNELQNPMSVAPPSVAPSSAMSDFDDAPPESPMSHFSHPPSPSHDSPPPSPLPRPPRPDTAGSMMSIDAPPTPIAFGNVQRDCMTPMSQRSMTPQPMPDQPPTPISHYPEAPPSPMVTQEPRIQHHPIQQPMSTNQVMNNMHQKSHSQPAPVQSNSGRMNLRERKEPPSQQYHQGLDQTEPLNSNRRRRVRRQLIIDQQIGIDAETMRAQLRDHSDIVGSLVMAPPVEKLLRSKEESNPEKLFNAPIGRIHVGLHQKCFTANCRTDLPACAILRQEEANVESFTEEGQRHYQSMNHMDSAMNSGINQHHDSDDEDMYSGYGPPSVASSYAEEQQLSHTDYHQKSYQDDQWAKATGQDISQNFESNIPAQSPVHHAPPTPQSHTPQPGQSGMHMDNQYDGPPTPMSHKPDTPLHQPMTPQAPETPQPMTPYQDHYPDPPSIAAPSPVPSAGGEPDSFEMPHHDSQSASVTPSTDLNESYEPEAKRLRTASAEQELKDVEAGKGTGACIKYTQRLLMENDTVSFNQMSSSDHRKLASQKFYSLLVMLKHEQITAVQSEPYADILINKGINFGGTILDHC